MNKLYIVAQVAVSYLFASTTAGIVENGKWTGNDWYDSTHQTGVKNGVPYSKNADVQRFLMAPIAREGKVPEYESYENVKRVKRVFSEQQFTYMFPLKKRLYTYDGFLNAVGKYPALCGEKGPVLDSYTDDQACARELSFIFAHFNQETGAHNPHSPHEFWRQGLAHIEEWRCHSGRGGGHCNYSSWGNKNFPVQAGQQYFGRGPFQLSWNYNYGPFSKVLVESKHDSHMYLLKNPGQIASDSMTVFLSAFWFYMTPQAPKPSMHEVASGFYQPEAADSQAGYTNGLGITTNIMNGGYECGGGAENIKSQYRIKTFKALLNYFKLPSEQEKTMQCGGQRKFSQHKGGYGSKPTYFTYSSGNKCDLTVSQTAYHTGTVDDYKRCICDNVPGASNDCKFDGVKKDPRDVAKKDDKKDDKKADDKKVDDKKADKKEIKASEISNPEVEFKKIASNPNFDDKKPSRTLYQVDQALTYIQKNLIEIHGVFAAQGYIKK